MLPLKSAIIVSIGCRHRDPDRRAAVAEQRASTCHALACRDNSRARQRLVAGDDLHQAAEPQR